MRQSEDPGHGAADTSRQTSAGTVSPGRDDSGFRLRGHAVTRTETFVDAAFAFSLTLLVIFHDDLPQTAVELRGALPSELGFDPARQMLDLQTTFIVYSLGFGLLAWLVWLLNRHALKTLGDALDEEERYQARSELGSHAIMGATAAASLLASVLVLGFGMQGWFAGGLPMWIYATLSASMPLFWMRREARRPSRRAPDAHGDGAAHAIAPRVAAPARQDKPVPAIQPGERDERGPA